MVASHHWSQWMDVPTCWVIHQRGVGYLPEDSSHHLGSCGCLGEVVLGRGGYCMVMVLGGSGCPMGRKSRCLSVVVWGGINVVV